ncbi:16S rRNA (cytosine(1402)-N(4))-methyltransferase RsmH [Candidatus Manganitrophus noduliformans]|uniref:Ribosomal RNA small subunit methyltransferase H n=1 Tax=Candidatus Manganitrophus noduliformans TaxID=2606439 RepID=A0A7X6IA72_9BACT|nr:16S rRNA (cytosine(1402)-N(4))-methyltransferase RsmH [Candidatus Manganitrophus noduliformans]
MVEPNFSERESEREDEGGRVHEPVLVEEVLIALDCKPNGRKLYLDCTVGLGGHTEAILAATNPEGRVVGLDRDEEALALAEKRLHPYRDRIILRKGSFNELSRIAAELNLKEVDGLLFDLGISSLQLDRPERGFSFQRPGPLDMRMNQMEKETAADWINRATERELAEIIRTYGEERWAKRIASSIIRFRSESGPITRTEELEGVIWRAYPAKARHGRIHPATRTFQAFRMVVNQEMAQLEAGLEAALSLLAVGGRLVVISFHSLEDRLVKQTFKKWAMQEPRRFVNLYKKPIQAGPEEIARNPRARSAKLRGLERAA